MTIEKDNDNVEEREYVGNEINAMSRFDDEDGVKHGLASKSAKSKKDQMTKD